MTSKKSTVGILGAGISGLSTAYALKKKGMDVTVYEKGESVGGMFQSKQMGGWLLEKGPNTMMVRSKEVWNLINDINLDNEAIEANPESKKRFIVRKGKPVPMPLSFIDFIRTNLFSSSAKLRLLKEPFISALDDDDESIAGFVRRRLGKEILEYAVNPFVSGIFAGDPEQLSIKHTFSTLHELEQKHGSILKGMLKQKKNHPVRKTLLSFKNGMQTLPEMLGKKIGGALKLNHQVTGINFSGESWSLQFKEGEKEVEHNVIISTLPVSVLKECMLDDQAKTLVSELVDINYAPMSVIHFGYKQKNIHHPLDGFGMLIPEAEKYNILGTLFSSSIFPERAPEGHALLTSFVGGSRNPELARQSKENLVTKVQLELDQLLGISGTPEFTEHTYWENAIPQYEIGYDYFLNKMEETEKQLSGFYLAGSFRGGVSVPDCIKNGLKTAEMIAKKYT